MKRLLLAIALGAATLSALPAAAQINRREYRQQERIDQGVRSGALTGREAARLDNRQRRIDAAEARHRRSGGRLTYAERRRLQHRQNRASAAIYRQKHDRQYRR